MAALLTLSKPASCKNKSKPVIVFGKIDLRPVLFRLSRYLGDGVDSRTAGIARRRASIRRRDSDNRDCSDLSCL
jgi:hypothetical protein